MASEQCVAEFGARLADDLLGERIAGLYAVDGAGGNQSSQE
jgi:hypothetical protein